MKKFFVILLLLGSLCATTFAQSVKHSAVIHFEQAAFGVDSTFMENGTTLRESSGLLQRIIADPSMVLEKIVIESFTSPEGDKRQNIKLAERRSQSIYDYICAILTPANAELIEILEGGIAWDQLVAMIEASDMAYGAEAIRIIETVEEETYRRLLPTDRWGTLVDSRNKHLMDLRGGRPYRHMLKNFYPELRKSTVVTIYFKVDFEPIMQDRLVIPMRGEMPILCPKEQAQPAPETAPTPQIAAPAPEEPKKPIRFDVKSNLLFDVATVLNVGAEVPIGNRWSVAGDYIFPWWVSSDNANALQVMAGELEGRYWFGSPELRSARPQLTGWFAGLYAGGGLYDFQRNGNGYQGEFFLAAGLSGGYAHTINRSGNLRMEYSLGVGYLETNYRYYEAKEDNQFLVWQHDGRYSWFGPTKAKVSLVWFFDWKRGGKR